MVGDGSYLMMNSEIATSVMLGRKLTIVLLDNGGFGCIDRLQKSCGGAAFNNLFPNGSGVDFAAHAASLGAAAKKVTGIAELEAALAEARSEPCTTVIVIATDPAAEHPRRRRLVGRGGAGGLDQARGKGCPRPLRRRASAAELAGDRIASK